MVGIRLDRTPSLRPQPEGVSAPGDVDSRTSYGLPQTADHRRNIVNLASVETHTLHIPDHTRRRRQSHGSAGTGMGGSGPPPRRRSLHSVRYSRSSGRDLLTVRGYQYTPAFLSRRAVS